MCLLKLVGSEIDFEGCYTINKGKMYSFEFACSNESALGKIAESINVDCICLSRDVLDLTDPEHLSQALGQVHALPGSNRCVSIDCTYHSPLQHVNEYLHGKKYKQKLKQIKHSLSICFLVRKNSLRLSSCQLNFGNLNGKLALVNPQSWQFGCKK